MTFNFSQYAGQDGKVLLKGFDEWFKSNCAAIVEAFTAEAKELFEGVEDFAVELYMEINF